ncbi:MAG: dTDP-4-dehydrorhamnose 3,5-epimerase family protein [Magnetococcales bacterium]|nr:dTDP-4-dehydrorhamnose 3,5-epimerase family protein [Magnetococcales bacterium]
MIPIEKTKLDGVLLIKPQIFEDFRGCYAMTYNELAYSEAFKACGVESLHFVEDDISVSRKHVLRGIHGDHNTWKLISCLEGSFYLVVINNISNHPQYRQWTSFTLSEYNRWQVLVPSGFGNGHLVLSERAIFSYKQSAYYNPDGQFTLLWNDPALDIWWPVQTPLVSQRDQVGHFVR